MTVAVSVNLSDGVVLAVDSAITLGGPAGVVKVYEHAEKLFRLQNKPIGIAFYGQATLGARSVGSYLREFEYTNPGDVLTDGKPIAEVVEALRQFFMDKYQETVAPTLEQQTGQPLDQIPLEQRSQLGIVVGGFSHAAYLSEVWNILIPQNNTPGSAVLSRSQGDSGGNWFAMFEPIFRYTKGYSPNLLNDVVSVFVEDRGVGLTQDEQARIQEILLRYEYQIPFLAMPMHEGIQYARFLVELVINHHRFVIGAPIVGGGVQIGRVTYNVGEFEIIETSPSTQPITRRQ